MEDPPSPFYASMTESFAISEEESKEEGKEEDETSPRLDVN